MGRSISTTYQAAFTRLAIVPYPYRTNNKNAIVLQAYGVLKFAFKLLRFD